jgi:hypothetical protein
MAEVADVGTATDDVRRALSALDPRTGENG